VTGNQVWSESAVNCSPRSRIALVAQDGTRLKLALIGQVGIVVRRPVPRSPDGSRLINSKHFQCSRSRPDCFAGSVRKINSDIASWLASTSVAALLGVVIPYDP